MNRLAHFVMLADGWRRCAIAFAAGATGALAMPPVGFVPALIVTMSVSVWLLDGCGAKNDAGLVRMRLRTAAVTGWCLGFGYFVGGLYWLGAAFLVEPDRFAWALPLGVLGLPAVLAAFTALGFTLALLVWSAGPARIVALALGLGVAELARAYLFTGFPWNEFGMAFGQYAVLAQGASIAGLHGLTPLVIALCAAPATLVDETFRRRWTSPTAIAFGVFVLILGFGAWRLDSGAVETTPDVRLRIMQPNLAQDAKFRPAAGPEILRRYLDLSDRSTSPSVSGLVNVTHLIWPESAFPFVLSREPQALAMIASTLGKHTILLTGAIRTENDARAEGKAYNSLLAVDGTGKIIASSDKVHLVPFGEYLPAGGLLRAVGLRQLIALPGGFTAGTARRTISVPGLPTFQPLICYEAIFPGEVTPSAGSDARPAFLLNVTNDGWFGLTSGPYQHAAQARLRAVEEGLPLVRAANTGVSMVVDPYGRVLKELPLGAAGILDSPLPKPIAPTFFARHPIAPVAAVFLFLLAGSLVGRRRM